MDEFERLGQMIDDIRRVKGFLGMAILLHSDLSGRVVDPLTGLCYESFNNFVDYHGELTDPKYKLRKRLRKLEREIAETRELLHDYVRDDNGDLPF